MKLKRSPTPLEQAEHWIVHWRLALNRNVYESPDWVFANDQLNCWLERRRDLLPLVAGQR